ncbi:MAG TPA: 4Fe-4S dicluster domain-containing protein [Pirellulales bacterium]
MSPATAYKLGLDTGRYAHGGEHGGYHMPTVELRVGDKSVTAPVWIMPGHADETVTVYLGNGRKFAGRVGGTPEESVGFDAYPLRTSKRPWFADGLQIAATGESALVTCTQAHHSMEEREPVRTVSLESLKAEKVGRQKSEPLTLYEPFDYSAPKNKWGMSIDLTSCIGCNACVVACQAENNIPVVGKDQVSRGREMHWIRVDRYMAGPAEHPAFHFQPLPCMHCENAPCEYVCPVEATVHSSDGLNEMIYNRCVGTRFCSNNCPYKVRRFNFMFYADYSSPERRMQYNPEVTVRSRGVMEKCTYCVQRIRQAQIGAETERRALVDGDVLTACQAACPTRAIVFGDMNDAKSKVKKMKDSSLNYSLLDELNTEPRTTYLAELRNPNSELA